jgi:hypothetical protein
MQVVFRELLEPAISCGFPGKHWIEFISNKLEEVPQLAADLLGFVIE